MKPPQHPCSPHTSSSSWPRGFALLETLMALLLLASGVLSLLWMHQQALALQRQQIMRAVAMGLADDLAERMQLNAPLSADYAKTWGSVAIGTGKPLDCATQPCLRTELAQWDMLQLQQTLQTQLPDGDAAIFPLANAPGWWGIVLAWRDERMTYRTDSASGTPVCPEQKSCWRLFFRPTV